MNELEYNEFKKRYNKFKKHNLPTPFWDEERQTFEYVYFYNGKSIINFEETKDSLEINNSIIDALGSITNTGFYYPFTSKHNMGMLKNDKIINKITVGHNHAHSFEDVVKVLYDSPESFSIAEDEEQFYSKQELAYLRRVQKYLLFIGMKDLESLKPPKDRYINKIHTKYENALIYKFDDEAITNISNGKRNFRVTNWYVDCNEEQFKPKEYLALIVDKEDDFKFFVEFTKREVKEYKDIKEVCSTKDLNDNDKVIVTYFNILEKY